MTIINLFKHNSNDEYVEQKKQQFQLEGLYVIIIILVINSLQGLFRNDISSHVLLSIGILLFLIVYYSLRKIFTGIGYPNIESEKKYQKKMKQIRSFAILAFTIFTVINVSNKLLFNSDQSWIDIIAVSIIFLILLFTFEYFSVKKSYEKNKSMEE